MEAGVSLFMLLIVGLLCVTTVVAVTAGIVIFAVRRSRPSPPPQPPFPPPPQPPFPPPPAAPQQQPPHRPHE